MGLVTWDLLEFYRSGIRKKNKKKDTVCTQNDAVVSSNDEGLVLQLIVLK